VEELEEEQVLPLDQPEHTEFVRRLRLLGAGHEWISAPAGERRLIPVMFAAAKLHPAAKAVGVKIGGWHDFRQDAARWCIPCVSAVVGHKSAELAPEVYDRANQHESRAGLGVVGKQ
jgi:hypothetical protein